MNEMVGGGGTTGRDVVGDRAIPKILRDPQEDLDADQEPLAPSRWWPSSSS